MECVGVFEFRTVVEMVGVAVDVFELATDLVPLGVPVLVLEVVIDDVPVFVEGIDRVILIEAVLDTDAVDDLVEADVFVKDGLAEELLLTNDDRDNVVEEVDVLDCKSDAVGVFVTIALTVCRGVDVIVLDVMDEEEDTGDEEGVFVETPVLVDVLVEVVVLVDVDDTVTMDVPIAERVTVVVLVEVLDCVEVEDSIAPVIDKSRSSQNVGENEERSINNRRSICPGLLK